MSSDFHSFSIPLGTCVWLLYLWGNRDQRGLRFVVLSQDIVEEEEADTACSPLHSAKIHLSLWCFCFAFDFLAFFGNNPVQCKTILYCSATDTVDCYQNIVAKVNRPCNKQNFSIKLEDVSLSIANASSVWDRG